MDGVRVRLQFTVKHAVWTTQVWCGLCPGVSPPVTKSTKVDGRSGTSADVYEQRTSETDGFGGVSRVGGRGYIRVSEKRKRQNE